VQEFCAEGDFMQGKRLLILVGLLLSLWNLRVAQVEGQTRIRMGYSGSGIGADDLIRVMMKEKIWQKYGLEVTPIYFNSGSLVAQALLAGEIHTSESDVPTLLNLGVSGLIDVKLIAVTINRLEHSFVVRNAIKTPDDLRNKKIAISRFGSGSDITTRLALRFWNLDPDNDLTLLQVGNTPTRMSSLTAGHVDGCLINPAYVHRVLASGCCRVLAELTDLPMDYARTGQVVATHLLKKQPQIVSQHLKALIEGIHVYKTRPHVVLEVYKELGMKDPDAAKQTYQRIAKSLREYPVPENDGVQAVLDSLPHPKARNAKASQFIDASVIEEIKASGFIDGLSGKK
jgi:ABC-type nitrate/sulfonate/bicarbonate transport system substrate-binding protein